MPSGMGPVLVASGTADSDAAVAAHTFLRLVGVAISETGAAAADAEVQIVHGATVSGGTVVVPPINLVGNEFKYMEFGNGGIPCPNGISVDRVAGTTTLVLYVGRV